MKFLPVVLAVLAGFSEAKKSISGKALQSRMSKGEFNKAKLMRGAKPYAKGGRKLEEAEQEEWEINGLYSIQFNSCLSLTMQDEELFGEDIIYYAQNGMVTSEKSYILFDVCYTADCYYDADDSKMTFITDVASFFQAFADFLPNQVEQYCEGCNQNQDYCFGNLEEDEEAEEEGEDAEEGEEGEGEEGEGEGEGDRKLSKKNRRFLANNRVVEYIDCDQCYEYDCFDAEEEEEQGDDAEEQYEFEAALEWLDAIAECQQIEDYTMGDLALYAGLICNEAGTGVEIGVFLNEECTMYTNQKSFSSVMSYADQQYYTMSTEVVEYMFTNDFSCYQEEIEYTNPYAEQEEEEEEEQNDDYEVPEAAEWCQNLFQNDVVDMYDCGADENEEQQEEEEEEYDEYLYNYEWYSYQLTEEDANEPQDVCEVVKALEGEYSTVYDGEGSGSLYSYKKNGASDREGMSGAGKFFIVLVVLAAIGGAAVFFWKKESANDKKAPLINDGTMA